MLAFFALLTTAAFAADDGVGIKPLLGWRDWNECVRTTTPLPKNKP
jgi:hypothetical protein